jgi:hypothetical protein
MAGFQEVVTCLHLRAGCVWSCRIFNSGAACELWVPFVSLFVFAMKAHNQRDPCRGHFQNLIILFSFWVDPTLSVVGWRRKGRPMEGSVFSLNPLSCLWLVSLAMQRVVAPGWAVWTMSQLLRSDWHRLPFLSWLVLMLALELSRKLGNHHRFISKTRKLFWTIYPFSDGLLVWVIFL